MFFFSVSQWRPGVERVRKVMGGAGKTIGDLKLFRVTNKGASVTPREASGSVCQSESW